MKNAVSGYAINPYAECLDDVQDKVYASDLFHKE